MVRLSSTALPAVLLVATAGSAIAQGDDCSSATPIAATGTYFFDNTASTSSGFSGGGAPCFAFPDDDAPASDVFWVFTVPSSDNYSFDTVGTGADTNLQIHAGSDCTATCVAWDTCSGSGVCESLVTLLGLTAGDDYLVQAGMWGDGAGVPTGVLNITIPPPPPLNDTCSSPEVISGFGVFAYDATFALTSGFDGGSALCTTGLGAVNNDLFYNWTATVAGDTAVETLSGADTVLSLHVGVDCAAACTFNNDEGILVAPEARVILPGVLVGDSYMIQVGYWGTGAQGPGTLSISAWVAPPVPLNDDCSTAEVIGGVGSFPYDRTWATDSGFAGGNPVTCGLGQTGGPGGRDIFFQWTAAVAGDFAFDDCGSGVDSVMNIHAGGDCSATCISAGDDAPCSTAGEGGVTQLGVSPGDVFLIQIGDWAGTGTAMAAGLLNVTNATPPPANNDCSAATAISGVGITPWSNIGATTTAFGVGSGPCIGPGNGQVEADVFYQWTATAAGDFAFDTIGTGADTVLALHLGSGCASTCVYYDDDSGGAFQSRIVAPGILAGDTYLVQVGTWTLAGSTGGGVLNVTPFVPAPNDTCSTPEVISGLGFFAVDNLSATDSFFDGGDAAVCGDSGNAAPPSRDVFFVWTAPCDGDYTVTDCAIASDNAMNVYDGGDCSAVCIDGAGDSSGICGGANVDVDWSAIGGQEYLIQIGGWGAGGLAQGDIEIIQNTVPCPMNGIVEFACQPASMHLAGGAATMVTSTFSPGSTPSGLNLQVTDGSPGEFGFMLVAADHTNSIALFNGVLCLDTPFGRYNPNIATNQGLPQLNSIGSFDGAGVFNSLFGNAPPTGGSGYDVPVELPFSPAGQMIAPGDTYAFQCWYRDGASANFSDTVKVLF